TTPPVTPTPPTADPFIPTRFFDPTEPRPPPLPPFPTRRSSNPLDGTPANLTASRNIADNDSATVSIATGSNGSETGPANATFTVNRTTHSSTPTTNHYRIPASASSRSDYTALSGSVPHLAANTI